MADEHDDGPDERVSAEFGAWGEDEVAPAALRDRTLAAARARGLVGGHMKMPMMAWVMTAAAAVLMFVVGLGVGGARKESVPAPAGGGETASASHAPHFALFLFEDARYQTPAADGMEARVQEYSAWAGHLAESGKFVAGDELGSDGRSLWLESGQVSAGAVMSDAQRGRLTGYFIVAAPTLEDATTLARECPHLKYGGTVEVRPIVGG